MLKTRKLKKSRIIFISSLVVILLSLGLFSCKKNAAKAMPALIDDWRTEPFEFMPCSRYTFRLEPSGQSDYLPDNASETTYFGKAKMRGNDLYIKGHRIFTVVAIKDSIGTFPGGPVCSPGKTYNYDKILLTDGFTFYHFL